MLWETSKTRVELKKRISPRSLILNGIITVLLNLFKLTSVSYSKYITVICRGMKGDKIFREQLKCDSRVLRAQIKRKYGRELYPVGVIVPQNWISSKINFLVTLNTFHESTRTK